MVRHTRFRLAAACGLLLAIPLAARAGDVKTAEQSLRFARYALESLRFDEVDTRLSEAERALEGVDAGAAAAVRDGIAALRKERSAVETEYRAGPLLSELERGLEAAADRLERGTQGNGDEEVAALMEHDLERLDERLVGEDARKWLTDAQCEDVKRRASDLRARGKAARAEILRKRVERWLSQVETAAAGKDSESVRRDAVDQWADYAEQAIAKLDAGDSEREALSARLARARSTFVERRAAEDRDAFVAQVVESWPRMVASFGADSEGFATEPLPSFEDWLRSADFGARRAIDRARLIRRLVESDEYRRACAEFGADPRVAALQAEIDREVEGSAGRVCAHAAALLDGAEKATCEKDPEREPLTRAVSRLRDVVAAAGTGAAAQAATLERANALLARIESDRESKAAALDATLKSCLAVAEQSWPGIVAACGETGEIDPVACVEDPAAWRGKTIALASARNRAGWEFETEDYAFITPVHGVPVAGRLDPALRKGIVAQERATGLRFDGTAIDGVVGVVDAICRVQGMQYSQLVEEYVPTVNYKAPLLRIVAVKAGPFALSLGASGGEDGAGGTDAGEDAGSSSSLPGGALFVVIATAAFVLYARRRVAVNARARALAAAFSSALERGGARDLLRQASLRLATLSRRRGAPK